VLIIDYECRFNPFCISSFTIESSKKEKRIELLCRLRSPAIDLEHRSLVGCQNKRQSAERRPSR